MLLTQNKPLVFLILVICIAKYFCESKLFCQSFAENDFKIDFGFGNKYTNLGQDVINLVIGNQFWVIENNYQDQNLNFLSTEGSTNDVFEKKYKMGFYMNFGRIGLQAQPDDFRRAGVGVRHYTPMWKAYSYAIDWIEWSPKGPDYNTFNRTNRWDTILFYPFNFEQAQNLSFAFHVRYIERNDSFTEIGFVEQQYDEKNGNFTRKWNYWRLFTDGNTLIRINLDLEERIRINHLKIIDVSSSYLPDINNDSQLDYIVLFLDNSSIYYCYLTRECSGKNLKKLIDCKSVSQSLRAKIGEKNANNTLTIIIKVVIIIVSIIVLVLLSCKLIKGH